MIESFAGDWVAAKCAAQEIDAVYCGTVLKDNDWFRLKRVFEVHYTCGQPLSSFERPQGKNLSPNEVAAFLKSAPFDFRCFFLYRNRIDIFADIDLRCEKMLEQGFVQECIALVRAGCLRLGATDGAGAGDQGAERIAERAIGYRQALEMLCKWKQLKHTAPDTLTPEVQDRLVVDFIREFQSASRQFVKRQLSWFRSDPTFKWVLAKDRVAAEHEVLRLVQLEEEAFQRLYSDSVEAQLQHDARAAESSKEEQNALKRYQTQLAIFASPASRLAIAETIHAAVLSLPS
jgi:tRNA dimethylallyltransferase